MSTTNEKITPNESKSCKQPKKNVRMLRKRHDQLEKENLTLASERKEAQSSKSTRNSAKPMSKSALSEVKEVLTSENENEKTISESSESFDSNDEFRVELQLREDPEKGEHNRAKLQCVLNNNESREVLNKKFIFSNVHVLFSYKYTTRTVKRKVLFISPLFLP